MALAAVAAHRSHEQRRERFALIGNLHPLAVLRTKFDIFRETFQHSRISRLPRLERPMLHAFRRDVVGRRAAIFSAGTQAASPR